MTKTGKTLLVVAASAGIGLGSAVAVQAATSRSAPISTFDGIDEVIEHCTNSTTFVNMPQMSRTFTLGGTGGDEVVAMFTGSLSMDSSGGQFDTGFLRLIVDGVQQTPGEVPAIAPDDRGTHGFNWQTKAVTKGVPHTVKVQWRTDLGSTLCVDARSLLVLHK